MDHVGVCEVPTLAGRYGVILPILLANASVNHKLPSGPATILSTKVVVPSPDLVLRPKQFETMREPVSIAFRIAISLKL